MTRPGVVLVAALLAPAVASGQPAEIDAFNDAKTAFDASNWEEAVRRFGPLVDGGPQGLTSQVLLQEARKYYGASLVLAGRAGDGAETFKSLLQTNPAETLSSSLFPAPVLDVFNHVKREYESELRGQEEAMRRAEERRRLEEEERMRRDLLSKAVLFERQVERRPVWQGLLPFGIAQFQNDQNTKGVLLLVSEGLMLGVNIVSFWLTESLQEADNVAANRVFRDVLFYSNLASLGALAVFFGLGAWDGVANLERETVVTRRLTPGEVEAAIEAGMREER